MEGSDVVGQLDTLVAIKQFESRAAMKVLSVALGVAAVAAAVSASVNPPASSEEGVAVHIDPTEGGEVDIPPVEAQDEGLLTDAKDEGLLTDAKDEGHLTDAKDDKDITCLVRTGFFGSPPRTEDTVHPDSEKEYQIFERQVCDDPRQPYFQLLNELARIAKARVSELDGELAKCNKEWSNLVDKSEEVLLKLQAQDENLIKALQELGQFLDEAFVDTIFQD